MSTFESTISASLRADAEAAGAATDTAAEARELDERLDAVDRAATRRRWAVGGLLAAAAAAAVVVVLVSGRPAPDAQPVAPTPAPSAWTDSAEILGAPVLEVPGWAAGQEPLVAPRRFVRWQQSDCTSDCPPGRDQKLMLLAPYSVLGADGLASGPVTPAAWGDNLARLGESGALTVALPWTQERTAGAGVANVTVITTTADVPGAMGCEQLADTAGGCRALAAGTRNVVAVVDAGQAPLVVWLQALSSTDPAAQDAEMSRILSSLRLTGVPVSCSDLLGQEVRAASCVPDLSARIARDATLLADGAAVTVADYVAAVRPLVEQLANGADRYPAHEYAVLSPSPLPDDLETSTEPLLASWTFDGTPITTYVCFPDGQIVVSEMDCR